MHAACRPQMPNAIGHDRRDTTAPDHNRRDATCARSWLCSASMGARPAASKRPKVATIVLDAPLAACSVSMVARRAESTRACVATFVLGAILGHAYAPIAWNSARPQPVSCMMCPIMAVRCKHGRAARCINTHQGRNNCVGRSLLCSVNMVARQAESKRACAATTGLDEIPGCGYRHIAWHSARKTRKRRRLQFRTSAAAPPFPRARPNEPTPRNQPKNAWSRAISPPVVRATHPRRRARAQPVDEWPRPRVRWGGRWPAPAAEATRPVAGLCARNHGDRPEQMYNDRI